MNLLKFSFLTFCFLIINGFVFAQSSYVISGKLYDEKIFPLPSANILLYKSLDSYFVTGTSTLNDGSFTLNQVKPGEYYLKITFVGYNDFVTSIKIKQSNIDLGTIILKESVEQLNEVVVKGTSVRVSQNGDTTEYNANAYKVHVDATMEDLVIKMPGITVDNGKVQVAGEDVKKVTIDGQEYFGDDAMIALRNLPAEIISKIQVFDDQSDQARFTGFLDASTYKIINIITQNPESMIYFGKFYAGYATDDKYNLGGNVNLFNGKQKVTILGTVNNINEQNFSQQDMIGITGGNMQRSHGMGGRPPGVGGGSPFAQSNNDFKIPIQEGLNTTNSFGINYIDKIYDKISINGNYFYNKTDNEKDKVIYREYFTEESDMNDLKYYENELNESINLNHRMKLKIQYDINNRNSIIITPKISFQDFSSTENILAQNIDLANIGKETSSDQFNNSYGYDVNGELLYMHKFNKDGRTFSVNFNINQSNSDIDDKLDYTIYDFINDTISDKTNQNTQTFFTSKSYIAEISFTEQLSDNSKILFNYNPSYIRSENQIENYFYNDTLNTYNVFDSLLTNSFETKITAHKSGLTYQYSSLQTTFSIGLAYQNNNLKGNYIFPETNPVNETFHSILPTIMFMYKFSQQTNIRMFLRTGNTLPAINQLQEVVDKSNPTHLFYGNTKLKQDYFQMLIARFANTKLDNGRSFFAFFMFQHKNDYIGQSTYRAISDTIVINDIVLLPNTQLTTYKNYDKYFNIRTFLTYSLPLKSIKCNLNINGGGGYNQIPGELNDRFNFSNNKSAFLGFVLGSNINENIDFTLSYSGNYNWITNSVFTLNNSNYAIHKASFKLNYTIFKDLVLNTNADINFYRGLELDNNIPMIWNANIAYKTLQNRNLEIKFSIFDLLNQNTSVTRSINSNYLEDEYSNVLNQYFMLTLSYKFDRVI